MNADTTHYNASLDPADQVICDLLAETIDKQLPRPINTAWVVRGN